MNSESQVDQTSGTEHVRKAVDSEVNAFSSSGPWFVACIACLVIGLVLGAIGLVNVAAAPFIASVVLLFVAATKHRSAGGSSPWHANKLS